MSKESVIRKYSHAFYNVIYSSGNIIKVTSELGALNELFHVYADFWKIIQHPAISKKEKKFLITEAFNKLNFSKEVIYFFYILIDRGRIKDFPLIYKFFLQIKDKKDLIIRAEISVTATVQAEWIDEVTGAFEKLLKKRILWDKKIDNRLIGGFKVKIGDKVYDASVENQLNCLRKV